MNKPAITFGDIESVESFFNPGSETAAGKTQVTLETEVETKEETEEETKKKPEKDESILLVDFESPDSEEEDDTEEEVETEEETNSEDEVQKVVEEALEDDDTDYKELTLQMIKLGMWERFNPGDGVEIEDLESITKEEFETIAQTQKDWKKEEVKESVFKGLSDEEKDYLEFKKQGGNLNNFVQNYIYRQQAQNLEIDSDVGKKNAVYSYYKTTTNWSDQKIAKYIDTLEKDLELESEARMAKDELEKMTQDQYDKMLEEQNKLLEEQKQRIRDYKKGVRTTLKESYEKDKIETIVKAMTDTDEYGYASIDRAYLDYRNNPDKAELLYNIFMNLDEWLKEVGQQKVNERNLKEFKKIVLNKKSADGTEEDTPRKRSTNKNELIINLPKRKR